MVTARVLSGRLIWLAICLALTTLAIVVGVTFFRSPANRSRFDRFGDPLPESALARFGTVRFRQAGLCSLAYSPDGKTLVTGGGDGARLWDVTSGREIRRFKVAKQGTFCVAISPDGNLLATGDDTIIRLWDIASGTELRQWKGHEDSIHCLAFSPDGTKLASGGSYRNTVRLWDVSSGRELWNKDSPWQVESLGFSCESRTLFARGSSDGICSWDVSTGESRGDIEAEVFKFHTSVPAAFVLSPDGKILAAPISPGFLVFWDIATRRELRRFPLKSPLPTILAISRDSRIIATVEKEETVENVILREIATGRETLRIATPDWTVRTMAFSPDGTTLVTGGTGSAVRFWDGTTGREIGPVADQSGSIVFLSISPDGKTVAFGDSSPGVTLGEVATGREIRKIARESQENSYDARFLPDGRTLVLQNSKRLSIRNVTTGQELRTIDVVKEPNRPEWDPERFEGIATSPDGKTLLTWEWNHDAMLWDVASGKILRRLPTPKGDFLTNFAIAPDGRIFASGSSEHEHVFIIWPENRTDLQQRIPMTPHKIMAFAISPTDDLLAYASDDGAITLLEKPSSPTRQFRELTFQGPAVQSVAFSPDGKTLASGGGDGRIRLWDVAGQRMIRQFLNDGPVNRLVFLPDAKRLASASETGAVVIWDLMPRR